MDSSTQVHILIVSFNSLNTSKCDNWLQFKLSLDSVCIQIIARKGWMSNVPLSYFPLILSECAAFSSD
jgi:type III secretory pathway component EscS